MRLIEARVSTDKIIGGLYIYIYIYNLSCTYITAVWYIMIIQVTTMISSVIRGALVINRVRDCFTGSNSDLDFFCNFPPVPMYRVQSGYNRLTESQLIIS